MSSRHFFRIVASITVIFALAHSAQAQTLLNVSYDPTRELYQAYDMAFVKYWQAKTGKTIQIRQSHGYIEADATPNPGGWPKGGWP